MTNQLLTGISSILIETILGILGLAMTALIAKVYSYLNTKKKAEITKIGADEYNLRATIAKGIVYQVEQLFKFIPGVGTLKATMFDKLLLAKFPTLTQTQLDHFRESVVGQINSNDNILLAPAYDPVKDEANAIPVEAIIKAASV